MRISCVEGCEMVNKKFKLIALAAMVLLVTFILAGCGNSIAKINGQSITKTEFESRMAKVKTMMEAQGVDYKGAQGEQMLKGVKKQVFDQMTQDILIAQEAKKLGVKVEDKQITERYDMAKASYPSEKEFKDALQKFGMNDADLREYFQKDLLSQAVFDKLNKDLKITPEEIQKYYDQNKQQFVTPDMVKASHILIKVDKSAPKADLDKAKAKAQSLIDQLGKGADFAKLAKENTEDPGSKDNGGEVGEFSQQDNLVPEFKDAAFKLKVGEYTKEPVQTDFGWHIIKVTGTKAAGQRSYEEVKSYIESQLLNQKKNEKISAYLTELKDKAKITGVKDKDLTAAAVPPAGMGGASGANPHASGGSTSSGTDNPHADGSVPKE